MNIAVTSLTALLFTIAALFFPHSILGFYTNDAEVIDIGSNVAPMCAWMG